MGVPAITLLDDFFDTRKTVLVERWAQEHVAKDLEDGPINPIHTILKSQGGEDLELQEYTPTWPFSNLATKGCEHVI